MLFRSKIVLTLIFAATSVSAFGQDRDTPYWASLRSKEVNMRVGPSEDYQINWVYHRQQLPVKVIRIKEGWRLIKDPDGAEGWVVARLLSPARSALVVGHGVAILRGGPEESAPLLWNVEPGVVGALGSCDGGWCKLDVAGKKGYIRRDRLWGAGEP